MGRYDTYAQNDRNPTPIERALRNPTILAGAGAALLLGTLAALVLTWLLFSSPIKVVLGSQFGFSLVMMGLSLFIIIHLCAACILAERKLSAFIQDRMGPNRVGYWGLLQPIADGIKFILKEDITPTNVDRPIYILAPALSMGLALVGFAVIPWAGEIHFPWMEPGTTVSTQVVSIDIGLLYVLAVGSLAVYGVVLAGWASNNKYSAYGGMRAAAQMISYEIPLGLALLVILLTAGSLRPETIVNQQAASGVWNIFLHPIAFVLLTVTALAETNRAPFDLAECEQELIGGFHTEYSAMKFAMFFLGEYAHMVTASALVTVVFLGGWAPLPFFSWYSTGPDGAVEATWWNTSWVAALIKFGVVWTKICLFLGLFMLIRWTLPRFRFDQLMRLAWKGLVPMGIAAIVAAGVLAAFGWQRNLLACLLVNGVLLAGAIWLAGSSRSPITGRQENLPPVEVRPTRV